MFLSTNNCNNWNAINNGLPIISEVWSSVIKGNDIFIGIHGYGPYLSSNNGTSWTYKGFSLPIGKDYVQALTTYGNTILAGTGNGVYMSVDNGDSWFLSNTGFPVNYVAYSFVVDGTKIYAGTGGGGVFLSQDGGMSWTQTNLTNGVVYAIAKLDDKIIVGDNFGVFIGKENGNNWTCINQGLTNVQIASIAITDSFIFVGTYGSGIWKRPLSDLVGIKENEINNLNYNIYPNPTSSTLTIETNSNTKQNLEIVNLLGQTMYTYYIYSKATVDVSAFPKGIYILKLNTDKGIVVKKFIKQ